MLDGPPDEVLAGACTWRPRVTSWLGGRLLAAEIPVSGGRITGDVGNDIIETLSLTVPRHAAPARGADIFDWRPSSPDHPLAKNGQILDVTILVGSVITGEVWEIRRGRFQIKDWADDDAGIITVKAESLLARTRDDKLKQLSSPTGTLISEARRLLPGGMGASFDPDLVDRPVPVTMSWAKDRLKNLHEIASAWPALLRIDPWGQVYFRAPLPAIPVPVLTLRDGRDGTLIAAPRSDTRTGVYNEVLASTSSSDKADVQGYAAVTAGPMSVNGDYAVVTKEWSSPLIEDKEQADAAAATILSNSTRPALAIPARIAPDPRIELDDPVEILRGASGHMETVAATGTIPEHRVWVTESAKESAVVDLQWGWVTAYDLPLTVSDGEMRVDVGLSS